MEDFNPLHGKTIIFTFIKYIYKTYFIHKSISINANVHTYFKFTSSS